jgi:TolB-like protein/Tfp pilus assembly protein PilF
MSLLAELRRRNVFRMAILYVVGSWLILQMGDLLFDLMGLPDWSLRIVLGILILGFPVALVFSWLYELTPEGLKREVDVDRTQSIAPNTARKLNNLTLIVALVAITLMVYQQIRAPDRVVDPEPSAPTTAQPVEAAPPAPPVAADDEPVSQSIAVLPFRDMSADGDQDYFAEGIAEELLNALVRIDGLRVASRTSSFAFKDQSIELPVIAERLNVSHVLEGSVRTAGNRIRVTAQLIEVSSDAHLWSETYDRTLDDIFAIQDEITAQVLAALMPYLLDHSSGPELGLALVSPDGIAAGVPASARELLTDNAEAYRLYLRGRHFWRMRNAESLHAAVDLLTQATELDPQFARAWSNLAVATLLLAEYDRDIHQKDVIGPASQAADQALALAPDLGEALAIKAQIVRDECRWGEAEALFKHAIEVDPDDPTLHHWYGNFLRVVGYAAESHREMARAFQLDPLNASVMLNMGLNAADRGEIEIAVEYMNQAASLGIYDESRTFTGIMLADAGELDRAEPMLSDGLGLAPDADPNWVNVYLEAMQNRKTAQQRTEQVLTLLGKTDAFVRNAVMITMGSPLFLESLRRDCNVINKQVELFRQQTTLRQHPDFARTMAEIGLLDFWRERGFPSICRETAVGELECD